MEKKMHVKTGDTVADFTGGSPPLPLSEKRVSLQFQLIPGCDSV